MIHLLVDTSVLIKWFHSEGEAEVGASRAIRDAHVDGRIQAHVLDLAIYEVGNVLLKALRWPASAVSDQLDDLVTILGASIAFSHEWHRATAAIGEAHGLTFYDAAWVATARELSLELVSADKALLRAGLASSPSDIAARQGLVT